MSARQRAWWKEAVIYQIYPRSFFDSNGDGIGDIGGILSKLDHIKSLGTDVIWLCPVYRSPNDDNGYDISDYQSIMPEFGTMAQWEELLSAVHIKGMKLIMDLVVNHSSDEHDWFIQSRSSKDNEKRDYYIWRKEPNNWRSFFTPSAWEYDPGTEEYFLHLFSKKQPDLNWDNPVLRNKIYEMMRWWLDKGIDGFRMDVINCVSKAEGLPSVEGEGYQWGGEHFLNGPRIHEFLQEMNREVLSRYDAMSVGEAPGVSPEQAVLYTGPDRNELNMLFQFELMDIDSGPEGKWDITPWKLTRFKQIIGKWQTGLNGKGWNSIYLNNHDQPRLVSRFGDDRKHRAESAKMLATLNMTLQGTPYIYQGEEIGMTNVAFAKIEEYRDIETLNMYQEAIAAGKPKEEVMASIHAKGRDNARTPMQWSAAGNAGFTTGTPWLAVNPNYKEVNVEQAEKDHSSILHYYKKLVQLRKEELTLVYGDYQPICESDEAVFAYIRSLSGDRILVVLNFTGETARFKAPEELKSGEHSLLLSNYPDQTGEAAFPQQLRPYEAKVYRLG